MLEEILDEKYIVVEAKIGLTLHAAASGCIIQWAVWSCRLYARSKFMVVD
jgi:hypothetical protein